MELLRKIYEMTAIGDMITSPETVLMIIIAFFLLYLGIKKQYEPLLDEGIGGEQCLQRK